MSNETQEIPISRYVGHEKGLSFTSEEWKKWLSSHSQAFSGDINTASELLSTFGEAARETIDELKTAIKKDIAYPSVAILYSNEDPTRNISYIHTKNMIRFKKSFLEKQSLKHLDDVVAPTSAYNETLFYGSLQSRFQLLGAEEAHHAIYFSMHDEIDSPPLKGHAVSLANYDATNIEFEALVWQIEYAKKHDMPRETIDVIRKRYNSAQAYREKHGLLSTQE